MQALPFAQDAVDSARAAKDDPDAARAVAPSMPRRQSAPTGERPLSPLTRMALARARRRAVIPLEVVTFVAVCPACGADCGWTQEREETRVRSSLDCPCSP